MPMQAAIQRRPVPVSWWLEYRAENTRGQGQGIGSIAALAAYTELTLPRAGSFVTNTRGRARASWGSGGSYFLGSAASAVA